jgi:cytidylate kinase
MSGAARTPTLVCLIGPPAVGKTTVGQELCRRTGFKLFHGHVVADALSPYFPFGTPSFVRLGQIWRRTFLEEAVQAGLDVVTTVAWRFNRPGDAESIEDWLRPYVEGGGRVLCVELVAPLEVRLARNRTEERWRHKNPYWVTDTYLREGDAAHRYDSGGAFPFSLPHLQLETAHLSAEAAVQRIAEHFDLPRIEDPSSMR